MAVHKTGRYDLSAVPCDVTASSRVLFLNAPDSRRLVAKKGKQHALIKLERLRHRRFMKEHVQSGKHLDDIFFSGLSDYQLDGELK